MLRVVCTEINNLRCQSKDYWCQMAGSWSAH